MQESRYCRWHLPIPSSLTGGGVNGRRPLCLSTIGVSRDFLDIGYQNVQTMTIVVGIGTLKLSMLGLRRHLNAEGVIIERKVTNPFLKKGGVK